MHNIDDMQSAKEALWIEIQNELEKIHFPVDISLDNQFEQYDVVLFGCGIYGQIALQHFKSKNVKVKSFCDNDIRKQGTIVDGVQIISPSEISRLSNPLVIITARHHVPEITELIKKLGYVSISYDAYWVKTHADQYKHVYMNLLKDGRSEETYLGVIKSMISGNHIYCQNISESNAFWALPNFQNTGNEVFVDAGAYVGDTVEQFVWQNIGSFKKIFAFEPGKKQFEAMLKRVKRLEEEWALDNDSIVCVNAGLGETDAVMGFSYNDASLLGSNFISADVSSDLLIDVRALDSYMGMQSVTMIKADIEGFEMEMLRGAKGVIQRDKPKLALSIYHKPEDLFQIVRYVHELVPEYHCAVRHHNYKLVDTVLYCWI